MRNLDPTRAARVAMAMILGLFGASACDDASPSTAEPALDVRLAALDLATVGEVVWDVQVLGAGDPAAVVWQRRLTSSRYGDGAGSASTVGPCDADASPNTVRVWVVGLYDAPLSAAEAGAFAAGSPAAIAAPSLAFQNPTAAAPLSRAVACTPNGDNAVQFDVTLARPAMQGFFDVAIAFNAIFCSAKFDCCTPTEGGGCADSALLFDASGQRGRTFVLGLACTAGLDDTVATTLYLDDLTLDCNLTSDASTVAADLTLDPNPPEPGNLCVAADDALSSCDALTEADPDRVDADAYLFQAAVFRGTEALTSGGGAAHKVYWNVALGVRPSIAGCTLRTAATADDGADDTDGVTAATTGDGGQVAAGQVYPFVRWEVPLGACASEALTFGDPAASVRAAYTDIAAATPTAFAHRYAPGAAPTRTTPCAGLPDGAVWNTAATVLQTWDGATWAPSEAGVYDLAPTTTACHFVCAPNFVWDGATCLALVAPPSLAAVVPDHGATAGGDLVTLVGTNFAAGAAVTFDGVASPEVTFKSTTLLVPRVPAGAAPGPVPVRVTNADTGTAALDAAYDYGAPLAIRVCEKDVVLNTSSNSVTVSFTADECGGALPDTDTLPGVRWAHATNGLITVNALDPSAAGMAVWALTTGSRTFNLDAVYFPAADAIRCAAVWNPGSVTNTAVTFTAAHCGGTLPDASYIGVLEKLSPCGGARTFAIRNAEDAGGPGLSFWAYTTTCNSASVGVLYLPRADAIVCTKTVVLSGGSVSGSDVVFTAADCGGTLPSIQHVGVLSIMSPCGGAIAYGARDFGAPSVWAFPKTSFCTSSASAVQAVYFRR